MRAARPARSSGAGRRGGRRRPAAATATAPSSIRSRSRSTRAPLGGGDRRGRRRAGRHRRRRPRTPGQPFPMVVDTGTPLTLLRGPRRPGRRDRAGGLRSARLARSTRPRRRARRRSAASACCACRCSRSATAASLPGGVLGGDILRALLGRAALRRGLRAGRDGALLVDDLLGAPRRGPRLPGGRRLRGDPLLALRRRRGRPPRAIPTSSASAGRWCCRRRASCCAACAVPDAFSPDLPLRDHVLQGGRRRSSGRRASISSLMLATGVGPLVLGQSAWERVQGQAGRPPARSEAADGAAPASRPGRSRSSPPGRRSRASRSSTSRPAPTTDPGPCVELARARRIEQVSYHTVMGLTPDACTLSRATPIRASPTRPRTAPPTWSWPAQIPVAVIADNEPLPAGAALRHPPGRARAGRPRRRGRAGARRAWSSTTSRRRRAPSSRASRSAPRDACWAAARCPRLPDAAPSTSASACRRTGSPRPARRRDADADADVAVAAVANADRAVVDASCYNAAMRHCLGHPRRVPEPSRDGARRAELAGSPCARRRRAGPDRPPPTSARAAPARVRVAIPEFQLEGSPPPALGIQLQDGFVLGLGPRRRRRCSIRPTRPRSWRGTPSCSAATPRPASRRSASCWTSATSCA